MSRSTLLTYSAVLTFAINGDSYVLPVSTKNSRILRNRWLSSNGGYSCGTESLGSYVRPFLTDLNSHRCNSLLIDAILFYLFAALIFVIFAQGGAGVFVLGMARASSMPAASGNANSPRIRPITPPTALTIGDAIGYGSTHGNGIAGAPGLKPNGSTKFAGLLLTYR